LVVLVFQVHLDLDLVLFADLVGAEVRLVFFLDDLLIREGLDLGSSLSLSPLELGTDGQIEGAIHVSVFYAG
jgi:hypothetical protein